ncbi:uncharacterized protein N0V89_008115, partial [Didymosphaeria variabile]
MSALYTHLVLLLALLATFVIGDTPEPPHVTISVEYYKCGEAYSRQDPGQIVPMYGSFSPQYNCGKLQFAIGNMPVTHFKTTSWNCICSVY